MTKNISNRILKFVLSTLSVALFASCATFENEKGEKFSFKITVRNKDTPAPTIIVSHGGGCRTSQEDMWADRFRQWGYNAVIIDHCSGRGIGPHTGVEPPPLKQQDRVDDYIATAEWIKTQAWHKGKVAVFGISRGGEAVLRASESRFNRGRNGDAGLAELDVYIALYPACSYVPKAPRAPMLVMHGELDNLAVFSTCEYSERNHPNYTIKTYPHAHHGFDITGCNTIGSNRYLGNYVSCRYNEAASSQSMNDTKEFLAKHLKLI
jgi:dienelactone hydrolase